MDHPRVSGILLHPTSLPSRFGIGDLGPAARRFIDFLAAAGQRRWQVLPLGPTGFGDSPYACQSSFAGNPLLLSPEQLVSDGFLTDAQLAALPESAGAVDFGKLIPRRAKLLAQVHDNFRTAPPEGADAAFSRFCKKQAWWLDDYALFSALKEHHNGLPWYRWEVALRDRETTPLKRWKSRLADAIDARRLQQFLFDDQWQKLRHHAHQRGVAIIGDLPIYVPHDSADCWVNRELFQLDRAGMPRVVAGVPPDYFSATGQLWGNPVYDWPRHQSNHYQWWCQRIQAQLEWVDILRLDHFRGFAGYWEVPAGSAVATNGCWRSGPGIALFNALDQAMNHAPLPLIAEDLGVITDDVIALRDQLGLPGMAVLQFAFDSDATNPHLPHRQRVDQVIYTGTHDNDTTQGWYAQLAERPKTYADAYLGNPDQKIHWRMLQQASASVANCVILPMQDVLGLPGTARMNRPGHICSNWMWRLTAPELAQAPAARLLALSQVYGRV